MKHDHAVEISVAPELQDKIDRTRDHLHGNKKAYLFGLGGVAIGFVAARMFSHPSINVEVVVYKDAVS